VATDHPTSKILLIESCPGVVEVICTALAATTIEAFETECVFNITAALERLRHNEISAILLNLALPDSQGIETFNRVFAAAPNTPILILAARPQEAVALQAVQRGAQDYLFPEHLDGYSLPRALRNAIQRKAATDALFVEGERSLVTLNSIGDAVLCADIRDNVTYLNIVAERMTGWSQEEAKGRPLAEVFRIIDGVTRQVADDPMKMAMRENQTVALTANCVLIRRDGREYAIEDSTAPIHDREGSIIGAVIVFHDVSASRAMSLQMIHNAEHDLVTDLPNRLLLKDRITQAIVLARRRKTCAALLFLDLDQFKNINDSWGHAVGDEVLRSVSQRLLAGLRASDTVSRLGGDEFVILLSEISKPGDAATCAEKILILIAAPHSIDDHTIHIGGSIGISVFPQDGETADTLIQNADTAMYEAKKGGRNGFLFFDRDMNLKAIQRQSLEASLRVALDRNEFLLHYQPKVELNTGEITGGEALIRWQHPERGLVAPAQFIPIAEDSGLIVQIGRWVLREACRQARSWQDLGLFMLPTSVNVSAVEFRNKEFVHGVKAILAESGLAAKYLQLELTERVLMRDVESSSLVLQQLKSMGIQLAVDDFGTGYSSLSYLQQFPIDILKIDQSFVSQITGNTDHATIASTIIDMGKTFKHLVVAEGIETQEQRAYLQDHHCAEGQGYLFSRPVDAPLFAQLLKRGIQF
jgi:diguanylate cyclase (GGDEF)-like protein/PAS domain S-box-containing protein